MRTGFSSFFIIAIVLTITSCSAPEPVTSSDSPPEAKPASLYPEWYNSTETATRDSLNFYGFATSVASDSALAMQRAELQARIELGVMLSSELEKIRQQLESDGVSAAAEPEFILHLRTAHLPATETAAVQQSSVNNTDGVFRAFTMIGVQKAKAADLLQNAFGDFPQYWNLFSGSDAYQNFLK